MIRSRLRAAAVGAGLLALPACDRPEPADLVLVGGSVLTLDPARPEAQALAVRAGRIVALGEESVIRRLIGERTEVLELVGGVASPGFVEAHGHFTGLGRSRMKLDLRGQRDWAAIVARVAETAALTPPGTWILGWGWHQEKWDRPPVPEVEGWPTHDALSAAVPDHPVLLKHAAGNHAGLANAAALVRAGIGPETADPPGGRILRDGSGRVTGVLIETAFELAGAAAERDRLALGSEAAEAESLREIALADQACREAGVTLFHDAGSAFATVDRLRRVDRNGGLAVRLWVMLAEDNDALDRRIADYRFPAGGDGRVWVGGIKRVLDGALGSRGAWLLDPYSDLASTSGTNTIELGDLERTAEIAARERFQLCVHAIGDRANRETLDLYERVLARHPERRDHRWRIEHAQHLHPDDLPRFARLGVIASMQPIHCISDASWVPSRIGDRRAAAGAYMWRSLLDSGAVVISGTDTPVESIDPIANFHAAVTRHLAGGTAFYPEQRMTRIEALRAATSAAAWGAFAEVDLGTLTLGKLADIVVLDQNLLEIPEDRILDTTVQATIVGGKVEWRR